MQNPKQPISNTALQKAMDTMKANDTPETRNAFINEMMRATFYAPAILSFKGKPPKPDAAGKVVLPKDTKISFPLISTNDGQHFFMAFTSEEELKKRKTDKPLQTLLFHFDDFARQLAGNANASGLVIDPYGANLRLDAKTVASLKEQKDAFAAKAAQLKKHQQLFHPGADVVFVEPSVYPDAMLDAICEELAKRPSVSAAYLQIMIVDKTSKSYLVVLDAPQDQTLLTSVAQAAKPAASKTGMDLNVTIAANPLGQRAMDGTEPFYTKAAGRIRDEDDEE